MDGLCFYTALLGVLILVIGRALKKFVKKSTAKIPPGSLGLPLIGETLQFMMSVNGDKGVYDFVRTRRLRYGRCFKTSIFGEIHVFISGTESTRKILSNDSGNFTKRYLKPIADLVGDRSLLCASHQHHKFLRSRLINLFSANSTALIVRQFDELVVDALSGWDHRNTVVVLTESLGLTFRAMCKILMSLEDEEEVVLLQTEVSKVCGAMLSVPLRLPWTRFYNGIQARRRIMKKLDKMISGIRERRSHGGRHEDFLHQLLSENSKSACEEDNGGGGCKKMTDAEIKDNILTMMIAGQDTTASALTWMIKYLGQNQKVLEVLTEEQLGVVSKTCKKPYLTLEDLSEMPYATKVVKESLRMASVVPWFPRLVLQDSQIQGYKVDQGWNVNIDARSVHLDPEIHNNPEKFDPSRFDDETKAYSFLAFGMGGRTCLGQNMAKAMMMVFLHRFITTFKWEVVDSDSSIEKWALFARLKNGCPIRVTRRNQHQPSN